MALHIEDWRSCLVVPEHELLEIDLVGVSHGFYEIIAGDRLAIVAFYIKRHAFLKALAAYHGLDHAYDFGAFVIDRWRVEIIDRLIVIGAHGMRHGPGIFGKLR